MKAEQLMINDIVMLVVTEYNELEDKEVVSRHPARITDISPNDQLYDVNGGSCRVFYDFLDGFDGECYDCYMWPIPITEEILKANEIYESEDTNKEGVHYRKMRATYYTDINEPVRVYDINNDADAIFCSNNIKYVHELQDSLRICGFREMADKFKLK